MSEHCDDCPLRPDQKCEGEHYRKICERVHTGEERYKQMVLDIAARREGRLPMILPASSERPYPSVAQQAWNYTKSVVKAGVGFVKTGHWKATAEQQEARLAICRGCEYYDAEQVRCKQCGCPLMDKTSWLTESCPLEPPKWEALIVRQASGCGGCGK